MTEQRYVYFMRPLGMVGPIKIGCSALPLMRLQQLSVWSPFPLEIAVSVPGTVLLEQNLHRCFAASHSHHEWFHETGPLLRLIEALKAGSAIENAIDLQQQQGSIRPKLIHRTEERRRYISYSCRVRWAETKAERLTGERQVAPDDVTGIINRWGGFYGMKNGMEPSELEMDRLNDFLAAPAQHCTPHRVKYPNIRVIASREPTPADDLARAS